MAEAAVSCLLQQLEEVAVGYADLVAGAEREFDQLNHDLDFIKDFLRDIAKKKKNQELKLVERRIMDVVYEVEETIDTCLTKAMEFKALNFIRRRMPIQSVSIANAVKAVREQKVLPLYEDIRNSANAMIIADGAKGGDEQPTETSETDTPIGQNRIIGFDDEQAKITAYLTETRERLGVIAIVGIPGQGKTTLAWKIYQSDFICYKFPICIWVHMPREFNERDVFLQILKKFMPSKDISSLNYDELANTVRKCLEKEKFLLVLDDVWSVAAWEKIEAMLPLDNWEGKVLITTQEKNIGERCINGANGTLHNLSFLSIDESWELLQYEVFEGLNKCPENLEGFVRQIASKCDGVPLMIIVIGRVLKDQLMKSRLNLTYELETMSQSVSEALQNRVTQIEEVVGLSYHRLPNYLRGCFIFLGVFPEDYEIPAKMLCELWISEGFVLPRQGRSIEGSAEENMNDLITRNLLEGVKTNHMGKVKACRVNAMIRAFCTSIIKEENLCEEVRQSLETGELETSGSQLQKSHRLCFRSDPSNFLSKTPPGPHVRSLLCFNERPAILLESELLAVIPERFKKLRVLESKCIKLEQFPWKIVKLVHLRYLTLYIETLETLPEPITQLWNLQSLVIKTKSRSITMKANLWRMMRLRYLDTRAAILLESTKSDGEAGHNLHTLNRLAPESCTDAISTKAGNLITLGISGKLASIFQKNFLEKLHHLENLKLYEQPSEDMLPGLPVRSCFPPKLKSLTLMNTSLEWTHMSTLAMIETLEVLKLKESAFVGPYWAATDYSFSHLNFLLIANADLVIWEVSYKSFPQLSFLVLKKCENLIEIPEALAETLEKLEVERLQESAVASTRKIIEEKKYHFEKRSLQHHDWESPKSDTEFQQLSTQADLPNKLESELGQESSSSHSKQYQLRQTYAHEVEHDFVICRKTSMAESVANASLEILRDLLVEETEFLLSDGGDVDKVKADLRSIHALLMKADRDRRDSPTLKLYISQLKDLAFKAENLLETYAVEVESKREEGRRSLKDKFKRYICIMCECISVHEVGKEARHIISALADLTNKLESELGEESSSLSRQGDDERQRMLRQTYGHEVERDFVGMERDIELLVSKVKDETRRKRVVKIYGMGGLGKTTLARKVYNHIDLQSYARAWVCITQQFQPKAVFGDILKQLDRNAEIGGMEELARGIHNLLKERKCLVVIDDIWNNDEWDIIRQAFPVNCNVILTTRSQIIANQESEPHKLKFLTEDEGWALLQQVANLSPVDTDLKSLEDVGREIVSKCEGLPLSICVIGGILRPKEYDLPEWKRVNANMELYLRHGEGVEEYKRVKQVLELSYDALPYYLKPCFLYLACFPEDHKIDLEKLYLLWMAEGFISYQDKGPNETLRDVAQRYLIELVMRCMVQLQKARYYSPLNKFKKCGLHDLMHDLCSSKAEEEKFLKRIDASKYLTDILSPTQTRLVIPPSIGNSKSRLAISCDFEREVSGIDGLEEVKGLRSFMLFPKPFSSPTIGFKESTIDFKMSQYLRIFVVEGCEFEGGKLPIKVGKLIHLRYLSLHHSNVGELPKSICNITYLQTLDLRVRNEIRLPNVICKMKKLKHLFLPLFGVVVIGGEKLRLDGLHELETLKWINSQTTCIADIPKLISLQSLRVRVCDEDSMSIVLSNKNSQLRETHLEVQSCDLSSEKDMEVLNEGLMSPSLVTLTMSRCNISGGFPYYKQGMCQNLVTLELFNCKGKVDVEEFGKYPMLQKLNLHDFVKMTETITFRSNSFPQLKKLRLGRLQDLKKWELEKGAMPKLTSLFIAECPNLEKVPDGLRFSSSLRQMDIMNMPREFIERVNEEDYGPFVKKRVLGSVLNIFVKKILARKLRI